MIYCSFLFLSIHLLLSICVDPTKSHVFNRPYTPQQLITSISSFVGCDRVLRCQLPEQKSTIDALMTVVEYMDLDVWTNTIQPGHFMDIRVKSWWHHALVKMMMQCSVLVEDAPLWLSNADHAAVEGHRSVNSISDTSFFTEYHAFDDLIEHVRQLCLAYPNLAVWNESIGKTHEQRNISVIHITSSISNATTRKRIWFVHDDLLNFPFISFNECKKIFVFGVQGD